MAPRALGTLGTIPSLTVNGVVFTDLTNLIVLMASVNNGGSTNYSAFRKVNATVDYQVPISKTFTIWAHKTLTNGTQPVNGPSIILYGDTGGQGQASAPTNAVYPGGLSVNWTTLLQNSTPTFTTVEFPMFFQIPQNKYPTLYSSTSSLETIVFAYGYET